MTYGYNGNILHVDLSSKKHWIEKSSENFYRTYLGGVWTTPLQLDTFRRKIRLVI